MFARLLIVWLVVGQAVYISLPFFRSRSPTPLEQESVHNPSPELRTALEKELQRSAEYETRRMIGIITLLLAIDGVVIGCFWNIGVKKSG